MAKTHKKTNKRRKTLRKKYVGGVQRECPICCKDPKKICKFHIYKSQGAPPGSLINGPNYNTNAFYEDHIRTHPICKYCPAPITQEPLTQKPLVHWSLAQRLLAQESSAQESLINRHYDTKALAEHLKEIHNDKYNVARKIKTDLLDKNKTLITELNDNNIRQIGVLPELDMFYKQIADKEMKMAEEENKKQKSQKPEKPTKTVAVKAEADAAKAKAEALKAEKEAAAAAAKAKTAEEERLKREEAEKRKAEEAAIQAAKAEEQEAIRKAAKVEADKAKKAAKKAAKAEAERAKEVEEMGKEEELSKQLRAAQTVDEVVDIINNTLPQPPLEPLVPPQPELMPPQPMLMPPLPPVKKINIKNIFKKRILDDKTDFFYKLKNFKFQQDIHGYILSLFPLLSCNTGTISNPSYYETVSLIIFITGILNRWFQLNKVNIKLIIKGGKAAQMMLSAYGYSTCDINSDDIDILLIQENEHDRRIFNGFCQTICLFNSR